MSLAHGLLPGVGIAASTVTFLKVLFSLANTP